MIAYLDWSKSEDDRVDKQVFAEVEENPFNTGRRGIDDDWNRVEKDIEEQESLYSRNRLSKKQEEYTEQCIVVKE